MTRSSTRRTQKLSIFGQGCKSPSSQLKKTWVRYYNIYGGIMSIEMCPKCNKDFENGKYKKKFCSRQCANSRFWSEEQKQKLGIKFKLLCSEGKIVAPINHKHLGVREDKWEIRKCLSCINNFKVYKKSPKIYCCRKCNPKIGGCRNGSGRSKSGYYKGVYCGSTYELAWVIHRLDHNLLVERYKSAIICKNTGQKYFPDFIDGNMIIEIKGYEREDAVSIKTKIAESYGYKVLVLRKEDLQEQFDWVKNNYHTNKFEILFDGYKPKFNYFCSYCNKEFSRDEKVKTKTMFCSQQCCGKFISTHKLPSSLLKKEFIAHYCECGKIISKYAKKCLICFNTTSRRSNYKIPSKEVFNDLIISKSIKEIALQFDVNERTVRKWKLKYK